KLARPWAIPGTPGLEHRIGGLEKDALTGNISYDAHNHEKMVRTRAEKVRRIADRLEPTEPFFDPEGDVLVIGWGGTYGSITQAVIEARQGGLKVGHVHLRHVFPLPNDLTDVAARYRTVLVPELNMGQLRLHMRGQLGLESVGLNKIQGKPFHVGGIRCASRFPYYMNTYGFHGIHGRAPAIATGLKMANPDLTVWVVTGDGDGLSIGGNHLIHALRRNVDLKILLFDNRIYGLTKGQASPTSELGKKTKSSPFGTVDRPFNPLTLALGAGATFVARTTANDMPHMSSVIRRAAAHKGAAFVEIWQNCVVFNDGAFDEWSEKDVRDERLLKLEHGKPLVYGKTKDKGLRIGGGFTLEMGAADG